MKLEIQIRRAVDLDNAQTATEDVIDIIQELAIDFGGWLLELSSKESRSISELYEVFKIERNL